LRIVFSTHTLALPSLAVLALTAQAMAPNSCRHMRLIAASVNAENSGVMQFSTCGLASKR
jgi:hypothetical protein